MLRKSRLLLWLMISILSLNAAGSWRQCVYRCTPRFSKGATYTPTRTHSTKSPPNCSIVQPAPTRYSHAYRYGYRPLGLGTALGLGAWGATQLKKEGNQPEEVRPTHVPTRTVAWQEYHNQLQAQERSTSATHAAERLNLIATTLGLPPLNNNQAIIANLSSIFTLLRNRYTTSDELAQALQHAQAAITSGDDARILDDPLISAALLFTQLQELMNSDATFANQLAQAVGSDGTLFNQLYHSSIGMAMLESISQNQQILPAAKTLIKDQIRDLQAQKRAVGNVPQLNLERLREGLSRIEAAQLGLIPQQPSRLQE